MRKRLSWLLRELPWRLGWYLGFTVATAILGSLPPASEVWRRSEVEYRTR